jgi:tight adherence protein B
MSRLRLAALVTLAGIAVLLPAAPAVAAETGRIVEVKREADTLRIVFQADGLENGATLEPETVKVRIADQDVDSTAKPLRGSSDVARVVVLALDNSQSMSGEKLTAAKSAATTFLSTLPPEVEVGLVTFADTAKTEVPLTTDRAAVAAAIDGVQLSDRQGTALFDGVALGADLAGEDGARNLLLLTDGNEDGSSTATLDQAVDAAGDDIAVGAVYIGSSATQPPELNQLVTEAGGQVLTSSPEELKKFFDDAAQAISSQLQVTAELPASIRGFGNVEVSVHAGDVELTDSAFRSLSGPGPATAPDTGPIPVRTAAEGVVGRPVFSVVLGLVFVGLAVILFVALSGIRRDEQHGRVRRRLSFYTLTGRPAVKHETAATTALGSSQIARTAVELAGRVVQRRDFETALAQRLEAGGVPLRPAEWMIIHLGIAIGSSILFLLIGGGSPVPGVLGLFAGLVLPWAYLMAKESRRTSAFLSQLPDTLQLVSGSLSAGYSIPQAMDTVVREGQQPITGEFNRALVEARLGVPIEDAMDGIAERMQSKDFGWVVMAIRIQHEVGGNLAELLTTVSATLRERERLRRQVSALSAEGRLSAWILGLLPIMFAVYLALVRPEYLKPLFTDPIGGLLLGLGGVLLIVGVLWLRKAIQVEV